MYVQLWIVCIKCILCGTFWLNMSMHSIWWYLMHRTGTACRKCRLRTKSWLAMGAHQVIWRTPNDDDADRGEEYDENDHFISYSDTRSTPVVAPASSLDQWCGDLCSPSWCWCCCICRKSQLWFIQKSHFWPLLEMGTKTLKLKLPAVLLGIFKLLGQLESLP